MRLDPGAFHRTPEPPAQKAAPRQCRAAPPIEARPRHKRAAPPIGPDLDPHRAPGTWAARMKAEGVGDNQRVGRHCEGARLREIERREFRRVDAERALADL